MVRRAVDRSRRRPHRRHDCIVDLIRGLSKRAAELVDLGNARGGNSFVFWKLYRAGFCRAALQHLQTADRSGNSRPDPGDGAGQPNSGVGCVQAATICRRRGKRRGSAQMLPGYSARRGSR